MLSKKVEIPFNLYKDTIYPIVDACFSEEYSIFKVSEEEFQFMRKLPKINNSRQDVMRRLTATDRGSVRISDRSLWITLDVTRIIFFTVVLDVILIVAFSSFDSYFYSAVLSLAFVLTIGVWFDIIQEGNLFIDDKIQLLQKHFNNVV